MQIEIKDKEREGKEGELQVLIILTLQSVTKSVPKIALDCLLYIVTNPPPGAVTLVNKR